MNHLGQRLSALIDGELDDAERDRVLIHLAGCEPCRGEAVALRTLKRRMNALGEAAADAALTRRLMGLAGLEEGTVPVEQPASHARTDSVGSRELRPSWYITAGAVAAVLVGVGAAAFAAGGGGGEPAPRVTPAVDSYLLQHDLMTGVVPVGPGRNRPQPEPSKNFLPHVPWAAENHLVGG